MGTGPGCSFKVSLPPSGDRTGVPTGDKYFPFYGMKTGQLGWVQQMLMSQGVVHDGLSLEGEMWAPFFRPAQEQILIGPCDRDECWLESEATDCLGTGGALAGKLPWGQ